MLRNDPNQTEFINFDLPFGGELSCENRWVRLASMMPWQEVESCYAGSLAGTGMGAPAITGRIAYGALIIKERLGITDEETVEQIMENPYLQYFLGLRSYQQKRLFDPSMMVHFRSRFSEKHHQRINSRIVREATSEKQKKAPAKDSPNEPGDPPGNAGKLLVDANCTPADITYPTDFKLLGEAREKTEHIIDVLHTPFIRKKKKPRTYRQKARKQYLEVAKQKKPGASKIHKAMGQQLRYLKRNLQHIGTLVENGSSLRDGLVKNELACPEGFWPTNKAWGGRNTRILTETQPRLGQKDPWSVGFPMKKLRHHALFFLLKVTKNTTNIFI